MKFNSKFNNTSKAETCNVATPSKSGSFYTTLSHTHTQSLQKKWLHITKESLLITYIYTKLCKMCWASLTLLENSHWCFCNTHHGGTSHAVWDTPYSRALPSINDRKTERNSVHTIKPTCAVLYFQSRTSVIKVRNFLFTTTDTKPPPRPNGAGKCS